MKWDWCLQEEPTPFSQDEILAATDWGESFVGHIHVLADYTGCNGVGWVTDFGTVNQAYVAVVVDSDTGKD